MAYDVNSIKIEGQDNFKQIEIPPLPPLPLNIVPIPDGSILENGSMSSPNFRKDSSGWRIDAEGDAEFNNAVIRGTIVIGGEYRTVAVGESIQEAIDAVNTAGGGTVVLKNGTHTPTSDITLYSKITLEGQNGDSAIIDFGSTGYQLKGIGSGAYTTGTVSVSNNGTTVTGSSTVWLTNISAGQYIMLAGVWYPIVNVASDTSLSVGIPFADVALSGATYTVATILSNVHLNALTIKNSTASAIKFKYVTNLFMDDVTTQTSLVGYELDSCSQIAFGNSDAVANYTNYVFTNTHFMIHNGNSCIDALASHGYLIDKMTNTAISASFILNSAGDGMNISNSSNCRIDVVTAENAGSGVEFVSGNDNIIFGPARVESNGSDGIKLTATSDNIFVTNTFIKNNTGYGVNNVASSNDNLVITGNNFTGNTTSACNDSGTGTVIRGNVGLMDNATSSTSIFAFGGTGADGALSITSGTTNIDLGNAIVYVKNYSSISITGTGALTFTNPNTNGTKIVLKSTGNVTLTSSATPMINASALGADGGASASGASTAGNIGTTGYGYDWVTNPGTGGAADVGAAGTGGAAVTTQVYQTFNRYLEDYSKVTPGAGGGSGGANTGVGTTGIGGRGGGVLIIECAGAWNFTTTSGISVAGQNGGTGSGGGNKAGGGGGGGGYFVAVYSTLTANSGTITVSGGTGGNTSTGTSSQCAGGGGGGAIGTGSNGTTANTAGTKTGGDGGTGYSVVISV